jgi:DNA-binding SARP family transcriptional activator
VALNTAVLQVDIWDFHRAIRSGHYAHAVRLYRGSFLAGFERKLCAEAQGWIEAENQRIRSGLEVAFSRLVNDALKNDNAELACVYAQRYVDLNPLDDYAQELLLESYRLAGDSVGAFQAYQAYRATLKEAVGAEPPRQLQEGAVRLRKRLLTTGA